MPHSCVHDPKLQPVLAPTNASEVAGIGVGFQAASPSASALIGCCRFAPFGRQEEGNVAEGKLMTKLVGTPIAPVKGTRPESNPTPPLRALPPTSASGYGS